MFIGKPFINTLHSPSDNPLTALFLLYINDLANCLSAIVKCIQIYTEQVQDGIYADSLLVSISTRICLGLFILKPCLRNLLLAPVPWSALDLLFRKTLQFIFNSLTQPHFEYCSAVWGNCNKILAYKFKKLQNRAARVLHFQAMILIPIVTSRNLAV